MKSYLLAVLAAFPAFVFAQSNYHPGYVLKNNGDTLKGFINYREWSYSPLAIEFKISKDDKEALEFNPQNIKGFQINNLETYVSYSGAVSMNPTALPNLPDDLDTSKKQDNLFLRQLETGKNITLYSQTDNRKTRFFVAESKSLPIELKYYIYFIDSRNTEKSDNLYKGQFILWVYKFNGGDEKLLRKVDGLQFEQANIQEIVAEINGQIFSKLNNRNSSRNKTIAPARLFAGFAINFTNSRYEYYDYSKINSPESNNIAILVENTYLSTAISRSISPKFDFGIDLFANPNVQQSIFRVDCSFSYMSAKFNYPVYVDYGTSTNYIFSFTQISSTITPQFILNIYNKDKFKVYIDGGLGLNFSSYSNNSILNPVNGIKINPYNLYSHWVSFPFQAGVCVNQMLEFSFSYSLYSAVNYAVSNQSIGIGGKYLFK